NKFRFYPRASCNREQIQGTTSVFANFVKNFTTGKADQNANKPAHPNILENLEQIFSNPPFLKPSSDDIHIDKPIVLLPIQNFNFTK
ncbi:hypothetical protein S83_032098, partial [Arachis hypogaea]